MVNRDADIAVVLSQDRAGHRVFPLGDETKNILWVPERFDLWIRIEDEHELERQSTLSAWSIKNGELARLAILQ